MKVGDLVVDRSDRTLLIVVKADSDLEGVAVMDMEDGKTWYYCSADAEEHLVIVSTAQEVKA